MLGCASHATALVLDMHRYDRENKGRYKALAVSPSTVCYSIIEASFIRIIHSNPPANGNFLPLFNNGFQHLATCAVFNAVLIITTQHSVKFIVM